MCFVFHRTEIQLINLSVDGKLTVFTLLFHDFEEIILKFTHYSIYFCLGIDSFFLYWVPFWEGGGEKISLSEMVFLCML